MRGFLADITLTEPVVVWIVAAVAVLLLVGGTLLFLRRRGHRVRLIAALACWLLTPVAAALAVAAAVNVHFAYYDNVDDLLGIPTYPTADGPIPAGHREPLGLVVHLTVPDTASGFGKFTARAYLPPQYFSSPRRHFPVVTLLHGSPGTVTDWLTAAGAATVGLRSAEAGRPVILVMPHVNRHEFDDSECVDSRLQGNAQTYIVRDVLAATDKQLRTIVSARARAIGGLSMGGFCALNIGLKNPHQYSVVMDFSGESSPSYSGGLAALFGPGASGQAAYAANDPAGYVTRLNPRSGPVLWMDCGRDDFPVFPQMRALVPRLRQQGFTVEFHTRPGGHTFTVIGDGFALALPWAMQHLQRG